MFFSSLSRVSKFHLALVLVIAALVGSLIALINDRPEGMGMLTAAAAINTSGQPQYEMFLKLDNLQGESADMKHKGEIPVDSFAWSGTRPAGAKQPSLNGLTVTIPTGRASPKLFLNMAGALKISRAVLSVRKAGSGDDFLKWILTDTFITSYQTVGNTHGDGVTDQIVLMPGKIEVELKAADGTVVKSGWDLRTGKSVSN